MASLLRRDPINLFKGNYPTMWGSFLETVFSFYIYDELKQLSYWFEKDQGYWPWLLKGLSGSFAAFIGVGFSYLNDTVVRKYAERTTD